MQQETLVVMQMVTACSVLHSLLRIRSGREQFQVENMGLNLDNVLQGNQMPYQGSEAPRHCKVFWQIALEKKDGACADGQDIIY